MSFQGLFTGLTTLDLIYASDRIPQNNQKLVASDYTIAAGGPATNAAVSFATLGGQARLMSCLGCHPMTSIVRADLEACGVQLDDLDAQRTEVPPVSSILVTPDTGERAVISINATRSQVSAAALPPQPLAGVDIVLIDGHQMEIGRTIAQQASQQDIPVVIDGGSWKLGFDDLFPDVTYAICSANFLPPDCRCEADVFNYLQNRDIPYIAVTHGDAEIAYRTPETSGTVSVPDICAIDTLGAGDIFHGAFCYYILQQPFTTALASASQVAAKACQSFGTRTWLTEMAG